MVASGRAKKAKKYIYNHDGNMENLSPRLQRYMEKKINRIVNKMQKMQSGDDGFKGFDVRAFPCQKIKGQYAMIPINAEPVFNEEDSLWYLDDELIVGINYKKRERRKSKTETEILSNDKSDKAILNLEPEVLGDETK